MDNNELEPVESSSLPLTSAESQPPLVVDLPDGQKLVVGNLDPGTVVEVATWRGTGRPDSRTNRLMLGVTKDDEQEPKQVAAPTFVQSTPAAITSSQTIPSAPASSQVRTGIIYSEINPSSSSELARVTNVEKKKSTWKLVAKISGSVAAVALVIGILAGPLGMRIAHPQTGQGTSLGSASTSLIVTRPMERLVIGKSVIADLPSQKKNPAIAIISAVNGENVLLATDSGYDQTDRSAVRGSVFAVLPFFGAIFNLFG